MSLRIRLSAAGVMLLIVVLFPCVVAAQNVNPPTCCHEAPSGIAGPVVVQSSMVMTDAALASLGMSRTDFVDRLISVLMPGRQISLVYSNTTSLNPAAAAVTADGQSPETVTLTRQYRVPREMMVTETIESLDELSITDGIVSITISFRRAESTVPIS